MSRSVDASGLPSQVSVSLGRGDGWAQPARWYTSSAPVNTSLPSSRESSFALADLNDDEMADLVVISGVTVYALYSSGNAFTSTLARTAARSLRAVAALDPANPEAGAQAEAQSTRKRRRLHAAEAAEADVADSADEAVRLRQLLQASTGAGSLATYLPSMLSMRQAAQQSAAQVAKSLPGVFLTRPDSCDAAWGAAWPNAAPECATSSSSDPSPSSSDDFPAVRAPRPAASSPLAVSLGSLPSTLLDCWMHPTGIPLLHNAEGQQLLFVCPTGGSG